MNPDQEIKVELGDANNYIIILNKIVGNLIDQFGIIEVWIIKIKNWFDHKWLNYSGTSVVEFRGGGGLIDSSLNNEWRQKVTVLPFI